MKVFNRILKSGAIDQSPMSCKSRRTESLRMYESTGIYWRTTMLARNYLKAGV